MVWPRSVMALLLLLMEMVVVVVARLKTKKEMEIHFFAIGQQGGSDEVLQVLGQPGKGVSAFVLVLVFVFVFVPTPVGKRWEARRQRQGWT